MGVRTIALSLLLCVAAVAQADFTGHVTGPDGGPLAGAYVWMQSYGHNTRHPAHTKTDADGRFVHRTADRSASAWVVAGDLSTPVTDVEAGQTAELRAVPGRRVRGQVVDQEGEPVAGAVVRLAEIGILQIEDEAAAPAAVTVAGGWYELSGLPLPCYAELRAEVRGSAVGTARVEPDTDPRPLLMAPYGGRVARTGVKGRVLRDGQPVAGAGVTAVHGKRRGDSPTSDAGTFEIGGLTADEWCVSLDPWPQVPGWVPPAPVRLHLVEGQLSTVTFVMEPAGVVVGRVTQPNGEPAPKVAVTGETGDRHFWVDSDAAGRFRLQTAPGPVTVRCGGKSLQAEAKLPPETPAELAFVAKVHAPVTGQVVLPDGKPVAGATVYLDMLGTTETDATGHFSYTLGERESVPGLEAWWTAPDGQAWDARAGGVSGEDDTPQRRVRLVLSKETKRTLAGRVVDPDGNPVAGVLIGNSELWRHWDDRWYFAASRWTVSDRTGRYATNAKQGVINPHASMIGASPPPGEADLDQCVLFSRPGWRVTNVVTLSAPPQRVASDAIMEPLDGRVAGVVTDGAGRGVGGAQLLVEGGPPEQGNVAQPDGAFDLPLVPRIGHHTLVAMSGERLVGKATVTAGQTDVVIRLDDGVPPSGDARHQGALHALAAVRALLLAHPEPAALRQALLLACAIEPATGLAWIEQLPELDDRRRGWAECLPTLARTDPRRALALLPDVIQVVDAPLRCRAIGGLVAAMPEPVPAEARQALEHEIRLLGGQPGIGGSPTCWAGLLPAMARLGDDRTRPGLVLWAGPELPSELRTELARALWFRPDLAQIVLSPYVNVGERAYIARRLAEQDPHRALAYMPVPQDVLASLRIAARDGAALAVSLAPIDPATAFAIADRRTQWPDPDGGLRGHIILAMTDRVAALERLKAAPADVPPGWLVTSGSLVQAAALLDPPLARLLLARLRASGWNPEDDADLVPVAPNLARLDLERSASRSISVPRQQSRLYAEANDPPPALAETAHGRLLAAFCALDPERAIDVAGSTFVAPEDRVERLLFVAQTLGGVDWLPY